MSRPTNAYAESAAYWDAHDAAADARADLIAEHGRSARTWSYDPPRAGYFPTVGADGFDADGWHVR